MSDRRPHMRNRGRMKENGFDDSKQADAQPSRRSPRERVPTRKINLGPHNTSSKDYNISIPDDNEEYYSQSGRSGGPRGGTSPTNQSASSNGKKKNHRKRSMSTMRGENDNGRRQEQSERTEQGSSNGNAQGSGAEDEQDDLQRQITSSAERLIKLDAKIYNESIIGDADNVVRRLLLPASLPWTHRSELVARTMPRDIDEIPGILNMGDLTQRTMFNAKSGSNKKEESRHGSVHQTLRRGDDPGVLELTRQFHLLPEVLDSMEERREQTNQDFGHPLTSTKLRLYSFREASEAKRRRFEMTPLRTDVKHLSIRFGSSSSRTTIFPSKQSSLSSTQPLLLHALYSEDHQKGKKISLKKANELARKWGSYDHRFGLANSTLTNGRVRAGRSRVMWSSKTPGTRTYQSMITGKVLHGGEHKVPTQVVVGVRINGRLLKARTSTPVGSTDEVLYTNREIEAAVAAAFDDSEHGKNTSDNEGNMEVDDESGTQITDTTVASNVRDFCKRSNAQLSLDVEGLMHELIETDGNKMLSKTASSYEVKSSLDPLKSLYIRPPTIYCTPAEDGLVQTMCGATGIMSNRAITSESDQRNKDSIHATSLLRELAARAMACEVCWSSNIEKEDIVRCRTCDVQVHPSCHAGNLIRGNADQHWQCTMCMSSSGQNSGSNGSIHNDASNDRRNETRYKRCEFCPIVGGPMSRTSSGWCHEFCRRWCPTGDVDKCILCSRQDKAVVRCAAVGCTVKFHPMCAVVASKASLQQRCCRNVTRRFREIDDSSGLSFDEMTAKEDDIFKSTQYSLITSRVSVVEDESSGYTQDHVVPLAFCGIHNRERRPEFYGLLPGGVCYEKMFRIPSPPPP